jgi:hypothetical protein
MILPNYLSFFIFLFFTLGLCTSKGGQGLYHLWIYCGGSAPSELLTLTHLGKSVTKEPPRIGFNLLQSGRPHKPPRPIQ